MVSLFRATHKISGKNILYLSSLNEILKEEKIKLRQNM